MTETQKFSATVAGEVGIAPEIVIAIITAVVQLVTLCANRPPTGRRLRAMLRRDPEGMRTRLIREGMAEGQTQATATATADAIIRNADKLPPGSLDAMCQENCA